MNGIWKPIGLEHRLAFSVDCVIFGYDQESLKVLTIECTMPQFLGQRSLIGDLVSLDENLRDTAKRVIDRYTDLKDALLEQVHTFGKLGRHPLGRVISTAYYTLVEIDEVKSKDYQWIEVKSLSGLAFDHDEILDKCLCKIRRSIRQSPLGFHFLPENFTLSKLQRLYEVVLDIDLDKRNFRRKLKSSGLLIDTGRTQEDVAHRPAKLYRFDHDEYERRMMSDINFTF